jgi:hypothetical protein
MTAKLTEALCAFHREVGTIHKDAKAQYGAFADLAGVLSTVIPPLAKNGLAVTQTFEPSEGFEPVLLTTLRHSSGEAVESRLPMIVNKGRNALHDFGASCTYLRRYALLSILCLVADVDTDGAADEAPTATNAAPASKPKPKPAPTPAKAPAADPADQPLSADERKLCLALLKDLPPDQLNPILEQFRQQFNVPAEVKVSAAITTQAHLQMLQAAMEG